MIVNDETVGGWILSCFVWCQCTVATIELIIVTMTAFQHKYSNISTNTKHEINMVQYAKKIK